MPERSPIDRLDDAIDALFGPRQADEPTRSATPPIDHESRALAAVADKLRDLPRAQFRARLKSDLERMATMITSTEPISAVRQTASVRLRVRNAPAAIEFYKRAFGARELMRFEGRGQIAHAELAIGNTVVMLGEEAPEWGYPSPDTLGGSPATMHLYVDDADGWVDRAVAAGARLVAPVSDQFYGDRSGHVVDPFGYGWTIATHKEEMSVEDMHRRFAALEAEAPRRPVTHVPAGFRTVTPYIVVADAPGLVMFMRRVFGAEETLRTTGHEGGVHAEVRIGDSMLMVGGGAADLSWRGPQWPGAFHVYVDETDATYARGLQAGATSLYAPMDHEYGERSGAVRDPFGNMWYIASAEGDRQARENLHSVTASLHPLRSDPVIAFTKRAFGAQLLERHASPDGVVHYAKLGIADSAIELGDAHGPFQPMPSRFYLFVPDVDAAYRRALEAGGTSIMTPTDQPYGHRNAGIADPFGNEWFLAMLIESR